VPEFGKRLQACGLIILCVRGAGSFERRTMVLFVGDCLLLAASNGVRIGLPVHLGPERLMHCTGIGVGSQVIESGLYPLDRISALACQRRTRIQRDYPENRSDHGRDPHASAVWDDLLHIGHGWVPPSETITGEEIEKSIHYSRGDASAD